MQAQSIDALRVRAEQGDAEAQLNIAIMYVSGCGVSQDDAEAARWFRRAAEQGSAEAMTKLGVMCGTGRGVAQDGAEAVRWYRLAADGWRRSAEQGDASAMTNLGIRYASGWGVPQDYVLAHMWRNLATFRLAGEELEQSVRTRDALASLMTSEDLSEAQRLASEWQATHPHEPSA
jgi:TPR repeat protein